MDRKLWLSIVLFIGVASLLIVGSAQAATITVPDASFESPVVPSSTGFTGAGGDWPLGLRCSYVNPSEYNAAYADTVPAAPDGAQVAYLNGSTDYTWIGQNLVDTYQAGADYTLTVAVASDSHPMLEPSNLTLMLGYWAGTSDPYFIGRGYQYPTAVAQTIAHWNEVTDTSWATFTVDTGTIAAESAAVGQPITVWFGDENTGWPAQYWLSGVWCVDNCQLSATTVPEPSTIALLLSGAFALVAYAWRKRK